MKALHPRDDVDRLLSRKERGGGFASIEDSVNASMQRLEDYIEKHERVTFIRNDTDKTMDTKGYSHQKRY